MSRTLYLDCETDVIKPGLQVPPMVCAQLAYDLDPVEILLADDPRLVDQLRAALADCVIVGHNVAFDLAVILQEFPELAPLIWRAYDESRVYDTMLAAQMHDIADGTFSAGKRYNLQVLAERLGYALVKGDNSWQLRFSELRGVPLHDWPQSAVEYAIMDVAATRAVWQWACSIAPTEGIPTIAVQLRSAWALHLSSAWGLVCDPRAVRALASRVDETLLRTRDQLRVAGVLHANGSKNVTALRERAAAAGVLQTTAGGAISISADALQDVDDPVLKTYKEFLGAEKLRSTYLPVLERGCSVPIHPRYWLVASGRTSASDPNIQNLPRNGLVRECFVPRPGWAYVAADYHVVELVCLAQVLVDMFGLANCCMAQALLRGEDLHLVTASKILDISYDETLARHRAGDKQTKDARQLAKGLNFGIPGGLGPAKLAKLLKNYGIDVTEAAARQLRSTWLALYPEMKLYFDKIGAYTQRSWRSVHPRTGFVRGGLDYCSGANHLFQHLAAFGAKNALYAVQRACYFDTDSPLHGCRLVAFVHDELVLEVPVDRVDPAARELCAVMTAEFQVAVPDLPIKAEAVAMSRWCKDAKSLKNQAGELEIYDPGLFLDP
jgi:DNA polymerase-1